MNLSILENNKNWSKAVIVFSNKNFKGQNYSKKERSYVISSEAKYFDSNMIGRSLFGDCLDGKDLGVRLDLYNWEVEDIEIIK